MARIRKSTTAVEIPEVPVSTIESAPEVEVAGEFIAQAPTGDANGWVNIQKRDRQLMYEDDGGIYFFNKSIDQDLIEVDGKMYRNVKGARCWFQLKTALGTLTVNNVLIMPNQYSFYIVAAGKPLSFKREDGSWQTLSRIDSKYNAEIDGKDTVCTAMTFDIRQAAPALYEKFCKATPIQK